MILARAPLRVSFFGGGTDHPQWYLKNGGGVLSTTIDKYVYIKLRYLPYIFPFQHRIVWRKNEQAQLTEEIEHPVVRAILTEYYPHERFEIIYFSDAPALSGLGASSAFTVALLHALHKLKKVENSPKLTAQNAIHIERDILKEPVGDQDQLASAYGGFNRMVFYKIKRVPQIRPITIAPTTLLNLKDHCMLFFTGLQREAKTIEAAKLTNFAARQQTLTAMQRMTSTGLRHLRKRNYGAFGRLIYESWQLKKSLSPKVSNADIDAMLAKALALGAYGGKLLGAGGGGFLLLVAPPPCQAAIRNALGNRSFMNFNFSAHGSQAMETGWPDGK